MPDVTNVEQAAIDLIDEDFVLEQANGVPQDYKTVDYSRKPTKALFYEYRTPVLEPSYTIHFKDRVVGDKTYLSMRQVYIHTCDPTDWTFVQKVCHGDWAYWEQLQKALNNYILKPKKDSVDRWRKEMEIKLRSDAILAVRRDATSESVSALNSAKWLAEGKYKLKPQVSKLKTTDAPTANDNNDQVSDVYIADIQRMASFTLPSNDTVQ